MKISLFCLVALLSLSLAQGFNKINLVDSIDAVKDILGGFQCSSRLDIELVLDGSASVHPDEWTATQDFAINMVKQFNSSSGVNFGVTVFGSNATKVISVGATQTGVIPAISRASQPKGLTNTAQGLRFASYDLYTFGRGSVPGIVFLLLNSNSNYGADPIDIANEMKNQSILIYAIGATKNINYEPVNAIASAPASQYVFKTSYANLDANFTKNLASGVCVDQCDTRNFIEFVVDGSSSISPDEWTLLKNYLASFVRQFQFGTNKTSVGVTQFGLITSTPLPMTPYYSFAISGILAMTQVGGTTPIAAGLTAGLQDISRNVPMGVNGTMILITNGNSNQGSDPIVVAESIKAKGIRIVVLSIGEVNQDLISPIASEPKSSNVFYQPDFTSLGLSAKPIARAICQSATCNVGANIQLVLDGSASITSPNWTLMKSFSAKLVDAFMSGSNSTTMMGYTQFSDNAVLEQSVTTSKTVLLNVLSQSVQLNGNTYLAKGIDTAQSNLANYGNRSQRNKMIIMTDGVSNDIPSTAAANAKNAGTEIFCIGIGANVNVGQLQIVASSPSSSHVYLASSFDALAGMVSQIVNGAC